MLSVARWKIPEDFLQRSHFERVVQELDWNSSPGYPWCLQSTTNRIFFEVEDGRPSPLALQKVWMLVQEKLETRESDPIRLFIKPEAHSQKKLREGRYRLISSVSVVDQIIDQMLFGEFNEQLILTHPYHPIKTGWTALLGGWKQVPLKGMVCADKTSWDWTVRGWLLQATLRIRSLLCLNLTEQWIELASWRYQCLFGEGCHMVTSGGLHLYQNEPGVMKSGCVVTIADNSIMQCLLHCLVSRALDIEPGLIWCMGDDTMQESSDSDDKYFEELSNYCILKEVNKKSEFAGLAYRGMRLEPIYPHKHAFNLLHVDPTIQDSLTLSYGLLYHRSSNKQGMLKILRELSPEMPSDEFYDSIVDGSC